MRIKALLVYLVLLPASNSWADDAMEPARLDAGSKPLSTLLSHPPLESLQQDYLLAIEFRADVTPSGKVRKYQPIYQYHQHLNVSDQDQESHGCICPYDIANALESAVRKARVSPARVDGKKVRVGIVATAVFEYSGGKRSARLVQHAEGLDALADSSLIAPQVVGGWVAFLDKANRPRLKMGTQLPADHPHFHGRTTLSAHIDAAGNVNNVDAPDEDEGTLLWRDSFIKAFSALRLIPANQAGQALGQTFQIPVTTRYTKRSGHATADDMRFIDPYFSLGGDYEQRLKDQMLHRRLESKGQVTR